MRSLLLLVALVPGCVPAACAQPRAWTASGAACLAGPAPSGAADPATGCPAAIDRAGPDFTALDELTRSGGPHRYVLDPHTTTAERARQPSACCYTTQYPPPPPG